MNIRAGEGVRASLLLLHSFCLGACIVFFETTASALFLASYQPTTLPYVYISAAVVMTLTGIGFSWLEQRLSYPRLLIVTLALILVCILGFRLALALTDARWPAFALLIGVEVEWVLISLEFWGLAGRLLNIREGKRLFGLVGCGQVAAGITGGFSVSLIVGLVGTPNLLLFAAAGMAGALGTLMWIMRKYEERIAAEHEEEDEEEEESRESLWSLAQRPYLLLIFSASALSVFGYYFADYIFYDRVESRYPTEAELARFFGIFWAVVGIANLLSRSVISGRLSSRLGLAVALLTLPVIIATGASAIIAVGASLGVVAALFWLALLLKGGEIVTRESIDSPSMLLLYQPIPGPERLRSRTITESMVEPVAGGVAGALLLLLTTVFSLGVTHLAIILLVIAGAWVAVALVLRRRYTVSLMKAIARGTLSGASLTLTDRSSVAILTKRLSSRYPAEVLFSLDVLERIEHPSLERSLLDLLDHESPLVRQDVAVRIGRLPPAVALGALRQRLAIEDAPNVRAALLTTIPAIGHQEDVDLALPHLEDADPQVRTGAIVGVLRSGSVQGVSAAEQIIQTKAGSVAPSDRLFAAKLIGEGRQPDHASLLMELCRDQDASVRRAALRAAGQLTDPALWPLLVDSLVEPEVRSAAFAGLVAAGEQTVDALQEAFGRKGQSRRLRIVIAQVCGQIRGPRALAFLRRQLDFADQDVRHQVLSSLQLCGYVAPEDDEEAIEEMVRHELSDAAWTLASLADVEGSESTQLLARALEGELRRDRDRVFYLLSYICNRKAIMRVRACLAGRSVKQKVYALELMDNVAPASLKPMLFPILEPIPHRQRLRGLMGYFPQRLSGRNERLREIMARPEGWISGWTQACAVYAAGEIKSQDFYGPIVTALSSPIDLVRETAVWALGQLGPDDLAHQLRGLTTDSSAPVARMARFVIDSVALASLTTASRPLRGSGVHEAKLFATMLLDPGERRSRRARAANALTIIRGPVAASALLDALEVEDETVRTAVLRALWRGDFALSERQRGALLHPLLYVETEDVRRTVEVAHALATAGGFDALVGALTTELAHSRERLLLLTGLLSPGEQLDGVYYWYAQPRGQPIPRRVERTLERMIAGLSGESLQGQVRTSLCCHELAELAAHQQLVPGARSEIQARLEDLAFGSPVWIRPWTRVCALGELARAGRHEPASKIVGLLEDVDDMVRETAAWALFELAPEMFRGVGYELRHDPSPTVARISRQLLESSKNG